MLKIRKLTVYEIISLLLVVIVPFVDLHPKLQNIFLLGLFVNLLLIIWAIIEDNKRK